MYKPVSSRSSVRSLRQLVPRDYKKMSKTGFGAVSDAEREDASVAVSPEGKLTVFSEIYSHFWPGLGLPRPKAIVVIP